MLAEAKKIVRKEIKHYKSLMSNQERITRSDFLLRKLENNIRFIKSKTILFYWSMDDEIHTHDFIQKWSDKKRIILPKVNGDSLDLKVFTNINSLKEGERYGILEPDGEDFNDYDRIDLAIVPGVAFDSKGNRLGRGKAYYDKLLPKINAYKIALCFSFQLKEEIPADENDIKVNEVISE